MRIGLVSVYSFRPHVEHLFFVSVLLKQSGHEVYFLTCDGSLDNCYARALKGSSKITECPSCIAGGIRSYPTTKITSIGRKSTEELNVEEKEMISFSSACTLLRTETLEDTKTDVYIKTNQNFHSSVDRAFSSAKQWIKTNNLDGVICFNGRMDATRAIIYACDRSNIPFMTLERPWFSDGLQFNPGGNCLSLKDVVRFNKKYRDIPLTRDQSEYAAQLIASRFTRTNLKEWRAYNLDAKPARWPKQVCSGPRVLILPSSRNEFQGHPERETAWSSYMAGFDAVISKLNIPLENIVLRCHPNWGEKIGMADGQRSERLYATWAAQKGIFCIGSRDNASTFDLINSCDILILNGSSAALEAGACGKKIICLGHASYEAAGVAIHINNQDELDKLALLSAHDAVGTIRHTLRYVYTMTKRFAQYVDHVEALTPTRYRYYAGADPNRIITALVSGKLEADDDRVACDDQEENLIIKKILERRWTELAIKQPFIDEKIELKGIGRRRGLRWLDGLREKLPRGDLWRGK